MKWPTGHSVCLRCLLQLIQTSVAWLLVFYLSYQPGLKIDIWATHLLLSFQILIIYLDDLVIIHVGYQPKTLNMLTIGNRKNK
jgi:hypothetical protein